MCGMTEFIFSFCFCQEDWQDLVHPADESSHQALQLFLTKGLRPPSRPPEPRTEFIFSFCDGEALTGGAPVLMWSPVQIGRQFGNRQFDNVISGFEQPEQNIKLLIYFRLVAFSANI
jgi:hypothetical protein